MYCEKHGVFWRVIDSLYCPVCLTEYSDKLESQLKTFIAGHASVIKAVDEGGENGEDKSSE